jgi:hypothetical protein
MNIADQGAVKQPLGADPEVLAVTRILVFRVDNESIGKY